MALAKKRKIGDEDRKFNKDWENSYFFVGISEKLFCLICGKHVKSNLQPIMTPATVILKS